METIIILAQAISKARQREIWRLDINLVEGDYVGRLWLRPDIEGYWDIHEDGSIERRG